MDDLDEFEAEIHETLDKLNLAPELIEIMRDIWLYEIQKERRARRMH